MRLFYLLTNFFFISSVQATGLGFWEWSARSSALANANAAAGDDSVVAAALPAAMTQLKQSEIQATANFYQVATDFQIPLQQPSQFKRFSPIPSFFSVWKPNDDTGVGLSIHSRNAADISLPDIRFPLPLEEYDQAQARLRPILISVAPSIGHRFGNLSVGLGMELFISQYILESGDCPPRPSIFAGQQACEYWEQEDSGPIGLSGNVSLHWAFNKHAIGGIYRLRSHTSDENIDIDMPAIASLFYSYQITEQWQWHLSSSYTWWDERGVRFTDYQDPFGLLTGFQDSIRVATSTEYQWGDWAFRLGYSLDQSIDSYGGNDIRYRFGIGYAITDDLLIDMTYVDEKYAKKEAGGPPPFYLSVQNDGFSASVGVRYRF